MSSAAQLLSRFPKKRPPLPAAQQAIYEQEYLANREGQSLAASLAQKLEAWMHRQVAAQVKGGKLLEVGAGTLNQVPYMQGKPITRYDVVEPAAFLYQDSAHKNAVSHFYGDIAECDESYDAIFSVAAMEHIENMPEALARMGVMLGDGGVCVNAIPSEGGLLWGLSWRLSTGLAYKLRTGLSYTPLMRHEHVNNHDEIVAMHRHFFEEVRLRYFPLPHKHLSFYCCITAAKPKPSCAAYLQTLS